MVTADGAAPFGARLVAWGGTVLFAVSLAFFLFSYATRFGLPDPGPVDRRAVAVDAAIFTLFALHHSVFARERVRAAVARFVPPRLERSFYVWVASVLFLLVCAFWQPVGGTAWEATGAARWVLRILQGVGVWLTLRSAAMIDILELSGVRQLAPRPGGVEFETSGPYAWMRHPIYTGWMLIVFCAPTMTMTRLVFAGVSSAYLLVAIPFEERSLVASSGDAYRTYMERVRWKLAPGIY